MSHRRSDDLNLSLTGSQISAISSRPASGRPNSAQQTKRANSLVDVRQKNTSSKKVENAKSSDAGRKVAPPKADNSAPASHRSTASSRVSVTSGRRLANGVASGRKMEEEDFLAFFENANPPKIKKPSSSASAPTHSKKPSTNAVKVLWKGTDTKTKNRKPAWASKPGQETGSARSDTPHNIFRPESARSSDDDVDSQARLMEDFDNSLSQSINKLHSLQTQLSGVNRENRESAVNAEVPSAVNSHRSVSTVDGDGLHGGGAVGGSRVGSIDDFIQGIIDNTPTPTPSHWASARQDITSPTSTVTDRSPRGEDDQKSVANNMSTRGQSNQKAKASLSTMENSYQNIKHKTPVNQVKSSASGSLSSPADRKSTWSNGSGQNKKPLSSTTGASDKLSEQKVLADCMNKLTSSAIQIQRWYRRHRKRRMVGEAAMRRLLAQKKEEHETRQVQELSQSVTAAELQEKKMEERRRLREEKAREARQQAIKDLQKKREERKNEVKKVAEEEISFLQANGKIKKTPSGGNLGARKKTPSGRKEKPSNGVGRVPGQGTGGDESSQGTPVLVDQEQDSPRTPVPSAEEGGRERETSVVGTETNHTATTLEDLYSTLKKLEEEENFLTARSERKKHSWLDELEKGAEAGLGSNLTAENLEKLNSSKDGLAKSGSLTQDKLQSIISFLDEVQVSDRLSEIDTEISRMNEELEKPALLLPSAEEVAQLEQAQAAASEVTNTVLSQRLELDEKKRTVGMLQKALNQQRELTVRHARETEKEMKKRLDLQKDEYEEAIKRHLSFIDQLIDDKKNLGEKCEKLVTELKTVDKKYQEKMKTIEDNHTVEITKLKEVHSAAEKLRREKWIEDKTKKIKEMTVKGLEPEIQRLIGKHKADVKKMRQIHEAELLEADERAAQKYVKMTEELRDQLAQEKEAACARERESAKQRYEKQLQQEEEAYQQQRRRLYQEVQEEKDRVATTSSRQRGELEKLQRQLEDNHRHALESMREELDKAREEQERRHKTEIKDLQEKLKLEKESWEENYMKRHETWLVQKERELKDKIKKDRDKEIELVIERLEEDASSMREETERTTEQKVRRLREKYEKETSELEQSERKAVQRLNEIKAKMTEVEGENERLKVIVRQKDQEILDNKKLLEKMNSERSHVSDIIRQEFADRIVATDEENKRIKHEISEVRARHRLELERAQGDMEELRKTKDEEMEEVHKRVKQAIVKKEEVVSQLRQQYQAATKRADHLEGLLEQQRKQLLGKK
ncbi:centrosomal protein of 131 kDa [Aplysia californica]|uniref:Centrosomal protein of 131 kDa n=1 Tax=Aplysia californica TaxID=6500 RepID=A0ABM0JPY3_APLCA|nr:centrosomal protein of 131 kDa [Aplysia californica]